jgi:hypothetical protein
MLKSKSQMTCSYCSKILREPIELPCGDSICREHLSERDVVKEKIIKCAECQQELRVTLDEFKSIKTQNNEEKILLRQELEVSMRKFFEIYNEFILNRTKLDLGVFNHFQEMRFQIDEQREELKKKIDEIALEMIEQTNKYQTMYFNFLKEKFCLTPSLDETSKSVENELNKLEETFRNPNLSTELATEIKKKHDESLNDIQFKLNELTNIKDNLKAANDFKPNLSSFDQEEAFGRIRLNLNSNINSFKSQIINGEEQLLELIKLCEFSPNDKWSLVYRGTRDGFGSSDFHSKCDGLSNTLTILKAKDSEFIFGGFTTAEWESNSFKNKSDPNAFIFSLTNKDSIPLKIKINPNEHRHAICCNTSYGPTFGNGCDIHIANNANTTTKSYSNLGLSYKHPLYGFETKKVRTFLAGSYEFQLSEIEVYKKT